MALSNTADDLAEVHPDGTFVEVFLSLRAVVDQSLKITSVAKLVHKCGLETVPERFKIIGHLQYNPPDVTALVMIRSQDLDDIDVIADCLLQLAGDRAIGKTEQLDQT